MRGPTVMLFAGLAFSAVIIAATAQTPENAARITVDWGKQTPLRSVPTLQVVVNPMLLRGAALHDGSFAALQTLGADYVRYVPWLPYPRQAVAELAAPADGKTSWNFSQIDPTLEDFMKATEGHSVVLNFSTIPAWMFKTKKPVAYPDDPNQVSWDYTQGTELRDPSMNEVSGYFARLLAWYTQGGFVDEAGYRHTSGHHYKIAYWEVLNEPDFEHHWTPEAYTRFYDSVTLAMLKVQPDLKFMALALAEPGKASDMFEYFLNPAHHARNAPLDFITYHFYATPSPDETLEHWQYTFFDQEEGFLNSVRFVETIRKRYTPGVRTDLNELGAILPEDAKEISENGKYVAADEPKAYWNLAGAMYADLYVQSARLGIDVVGESQLVGYKSQFPSVSMMNYKTGRPNARYWILKLLLDNFGAGSTLVATTTPYGRTAAQGFVTPRGRELLVINKRNRVQELLLPTEFTGRTITYVAPSTGDGKPRTSTLADAKIVLEPFQVAVVNER